MVVDCVGYRLAKVLAQEKREFENHWGLRTYELVKLANNYMELGITKEEKEIALLLVGEACFVRGFLHMAHWSELKKGMGM